MATQPTAVFPDDRGRFGDFGGKFIPETLMAAVAELEQAYNSVKYDEDFQSNLAHLLTNYVGRPTPLYYAENLSRHLGGAKIYLKREDLAHTGAHKINNALGQALLAQHMGKRRIIAETGAGQHGVASATACAMLGLQCIVYMGEEDIRRQSLNVYRMRLLEAEVISVESGTRTLKDAINEGHPRLGHQRRDDPLPHRQRRRPPSIPADGARLPERHRKRGPRSDSSRRGPTA